MFDIFLYLVINIDYCYVQCGSAFSLYSWLTFGPYGDRAGLGA